MSRLRIRIELNRGGVGVPLNKLASVVQQSPRRGVALAFRLRIAPLGDAIA